MHQNTTAAAERARAPKWHVIYSLLALFVVLVVGLALVVMHLIVGGYNGAISANEATQRRLTSYSAIYQRAAALEVPASAAFPRIELDSERARLTTAGERMDDTLRGLRVDLANVPAEQAVTLGAGLRVIEIAADRMRERGLDVLDAIDDDATSLESAAALQDVSAAHRQIVLTADRLVELLDGSGEQVLAEQQDDVSVLEAFQYIIAGFLLVTILGATYYGSRLRREFVRHAEERDRHVAELEAAHDELRQARDALEDRVRARTEELAAANEALRDEVATRMRTEAELRMSEERYALAAHSANDGLWDWDLRADHFYYSPRWRSLLGYEQDVLARSVSEWLRRVHPDDRGELEARIRAHLDDPSRPLETEHRVLHRDGTYRWMLVRATAVMDDAGEPTRMVGSHADVTARKNAELRLLHDALHDNLTGLPNRAMFIDRLDVVLRRSRRGDSPRYAVLFIDLDRFKVVNDSLGHVVGDRLLMEVARRLQSVVRPGDLVARFGGDEFTILVDRLSSDSDAVMIAERVLATLSEPTELDGFELRATASIGIALGSADYVSTADVLRDADIAMYRAKAEGRAAYRVFERSMHTSALDTLVLETELRGALERSELNLVYQPIVALGSGGSGGSGGVVGFEALTRWRHPSRGVISPSTFIAVAEESGDIVSMGRWVIGEACDQLRRWQGRGGDELYVAVNVSPRELWQEDFPDFVEETLQRAGLRPQSLRLEITESSVMRNHDHTIAAMRRLSALGVRIAIDDFGTGYSTLSYIKDLPVDSLKIDRAFTAELGTGGRNAQLVRAIVELGRSLSLDVVAEGVETAEQVEMLRELSCPFAQGYLFYVPMSVDDVDHFVFAPEQLTGAAG